MGQQTSWVALRAHWGPMQGSNTQEGQTARPMVLLNYARLRQKASSLYTGNTCCQGRNPAAQQASHCLKPVAAARAMASSPAVDSGTCAARRAPSVLTAHCGAAAHLLDCRGRLSRHERLAVGCSCAPVRLLRACAKLSRPAYTILHNHLSIAFKLIFTSQAHLSQARPLCIRHSVSRANAHYITRHANSCCGCAFRCSLRSDCCG